MSSQENLVGLPSDKLGLVADFVAKLRHQSGFEEQVRLFLGGKNPFEAPIKSPKSPLERLVSQTARMLSKRFGKRIVVDPLPPEFTEERLAYWASFNFHPVFLPGENITEERPLKGWTKFSAWFYQHARNGDIKPIWQDMPPTMLQRGWYLADFTVSADYTDGSQVFVDDPLSPIIAKLRKQKIIGKDDNTPMGSRFAISPAEWQDCVLFAHIASKLCVTRAQMRLERASEFNAIGNLYDSNRGKFNTWEWFHDQFEGGSGRLCGGGRDYGGLAYVSYGWGGGRSSSIAGRPLVSFVR